MRRTHNALILKQVNDNREASSITSNLREDAWLASVGAAEVRPSGRKSDRPVA
jgi:hypothetical protein